MSRASWRIGYAALAVGALAMVAGCHTDMWRQPKTSVQGSFDTAVFPDGMADRPSVPGTVARGRIRHDDAFYSGFEGRKLVSTPPKTLLIGGRSLSTSDSEDLETIIRRGRERFDIFCRHCHGARGDGKGMIAQRGLSLRRQPGNYHTERLRKMPLGHFYDVITNGYGVMFSYASRLDPDDRWAVAAYVRALQLSQFAPVAELASSDVERLDKSTGSTSTEQEHAQ